MKRILSIAAIVAALVMPGAAFADSSAETLISARTVTLSGVPATIDYGTVAGSYTNIRWDGGTLNGATPGNSGAISITFGADSGAAAVLTADGTLLTNGGNTIAKTNRRICKAGTFTGASDGGFANCTLGNSTMATNQVVGTQSAAGANGTALIHVGWNLTAPVPGTWTGTLTITAS